MSDARDDKHEQSREDELESMTSVARYVITKHKRRFAQDSDYAEAEPSEAVYLASAFLKFCAPSAEGSSGALREIAKMMDEAEAVLRSEVLAGNVVKESAARGELVGLRQARAVLTVPLNESHAGDIDKERTAEEWRIGWIVRENQIAFYKGKAQELERMLKEMQSATGATKLWACRAPSARMVVSNVGAAFVCEDCGANQDEPECRYLRSPESGIKEKP